MSFQLENQGNFEYTATVSIYSDANSSVIRDFIVVDFGLITDTLHLSNATVLNPSVLLKNYVGSVVYPANGLYQITVDEGFRVGGIANFSNSSSSAMVNTHELNITPFGPVNTPVFLSDFTTSTENQGVYTYDPMAMDFDGDSLSFELVNCNGTGYSIPDNTFIDSATGVITSAPAQTGMYSYCFKVAEWRSGVSSIPVSESFHELLIDVQSTTSVQEVRPDIEIQVYPNPSNDRVVIAAAMREIVELRIFAMDGAIVLEDSPEAIEVNYSLKRIPSGVYAVHVRTDLGSTVVRFVKNN